MADPTRLKRAASSGWLVGCCAVALSLLLAAQAFAVITVTVGTNNGFPGGNLTLTLSMTRLSTDPTVSGVQTDVIYDTTQIQLIGSCSNGGSECQSSAECGQGNTCVLPCQLDPRLTEQDFTATSLDFPPVPAGDRRLRLEVFPKNPPPQGQDNATFDSGNLVACTFQLPTTAQQNQQVSLATDRFKVSDGKDNLVPTAQVQTIPGMIVPPPPTSTPTVTPTPRIPCFANQDCPLGQVCDPSTQLCIPAPTPTPTIACTSDGDCPGNLKCVNGICTDLSTPTVTPTPLPTCTTDADCVQLEGEGFHCRAGVCVPIRQCDDTQPPAQWTSCRNPGLRETCTNDVCECGGDCNLDGFVYGDELTMMTCILSGDPSCPLTGCEAGDFDHNGEITGNEVCMAATNLGLGCPGEGQPLVFAEDLTGETRSLDVGSAEGLPGATVTITVNLSGQGDLRVATAQLDLLFDTAVLDIPDVTTACTVDPRLTATNASFTYLPQAPSTPPGQARLRLFVGDLNLCKQGLTFPVGSFTQGPLLACTFHIKDTAPFGASMLTAQRLNIGDPRGNDFTAVSTNGAVTVLQPTATPTNTETATATSTPTNTVGSTPTNTVTPTATSTATNTVSPTATVTATSTATNTPQNTPTVTAQAEEGGGGGGCSIESSDSRTGSALLVWLVIPIGLMLGRRRYRG